MARMVGYARVSTEDQRTARQMDELRAAGCAEVVEEHASGADRTRPVLAALLRRGLAPSLALTRTDHQAPDPHRHVAEQGAAEPRLASPCPLLASLRPHARHFCKARA
jgi:hypothetical protein